MSFTNLKIIKIMSGGNLNAARTERFIRIFVGDQGDLAAGQPRKHLLQAEQFEVVDQEGAREHQRPAGPVHLLQRELRLRGHHMLR